MEQLPDLVIELVSEYLSYEDLASLRVTCKRMKEFVDRKSFGSLYMFVGQNPLNIRLFYTNQVISYANSLRVKNFNFTAAFRKRFEHLRRLVIHIDICINRTAPLVHLDDWDCFEDLRELKVRACQIDGRLSLKHLKIASFGAFNAVSEPFPFELDCPRLKALAVSCQIRPTLISDANDLTHLFFDVWIRNGEEESYLAGFYSWLQNLRVACFKDIVRLNDFLARLNSGTLRLSSLNEIRLQDSGASIGNNFERLDRMIEGLGVLGRNHRTKHIGFYLNERPMNLEQLLELSTILKRPELKECTSRMTITKLRILTQSPVCECLFPSGFGLKLKEESELDEELIWKLRRIKCIYFKNKFELERRLFDLLIRTLRSVDMLAFKNVYIEPDRLEMMAKYWVNVSSLRFYDDRLGDLRFVTKFSNVSKVTLHFNLERGVLKHLFTARPAGKRIERFEITVLAKYQQIEIYFFENRFYIEMFKSENEVFKQYRYFACLLDRMLDFYYQENLFEVDWRHVDYDSMKGCLCCYSF